MLYLSEFAGSLVFLLCGYSYMCNISLKKTLVSKKNYIELAVAWSLAVCFGLVTAVIMGGPAALNPGVIFGNWITGGITLTDGLFFLLMEFLAVGAAELLCMVFFWDSFKASPEEPKRGIFSAYPVEKNIPLNFLQEIIATFVFLFIVILANKATGGNPLIIGAVGFAGVMLLSLSLNSTGFSMNAMRSFFSSVWFAILPFPNKNNEKVDWVYQIVVNFIGSSIGAVLAVLAASLIPYPAA